VSGKLKEVINEKSPGKVDFASINLSWTKGVEISDLQYQDELQGIALTVDQVSTSKGLLALATNYKDAGVINITRPQGRITIAETGGTVTQEAQGSPKKSVKKAEPQQGGKEKEIAQDQPSQRPSLPPINVEVHLTDGSLITIEAGHGERSIIENLNVHLALDGPAGALNYRLSFDNGQATGNFTGKGDLLLPQGAVADLSSLESEAKLVITEWQIADFLTLAASRADVPMGEGLLNGTLELTGKGVSALSLTGMLTGREIKLHGGLLLSDTPYIDEFNVDLTAVTNNDVLEIKTLQLNSPFATADLTAKAHGNTLQTLTTKAQIDIAKISSQFPATLKLQEGMKVSEGMVDIEANITTDTTETILKADAHLKRLSGTTGKKKISLTQPIDITVAGRQTGKSINLDTLLISSSFLTAKGSGNIDAMEFKVNADIGDALKELRKFIDLGGVESDGKFDLVLNIAGKADSLKKVTGNLGVDGFELDYDKAQISPKDTLAVTFESELHLEENSILKEITNTVVEFDTWPGKGVFSAAAIVPGDEKTPAIVKKGLLKGDFDLSRLTILLHSLGSLPREQQLTGPLQLTANLNGENIERPKVHFSLGVSPFAYVKGEQTFTDNNISMEVDAQIDLLARNYTLSNLTISSTPVALASKGEVSSKNEEQHLVADGKSTFDLKVLSQQLQSYADLNLEMSGVSSTPFQLTSRTKGGKWTEIPTLTDFNTSFHADNIVGYGLNIASLDLPIQLKDSIGEVDFNAEVNNGQMTLQPRVDFSGKYPVASLPDNSAILKDVELTGDMSNELLAKIHPLFKGVAKTAGKVNLDMEHMNWPVGNDQQKDVSFAGSFTFDEVKLQAGALLTPLLAIMKAEEDSIILGSEPMTFVGENQRVICSPLVASINEFYSIIFEGSVGFDQSLDYVAKIPITRKMVSSKIYKYLEGTYITVPISGTVSKPTISKSFVQKALSDLALQAGTKELGDQAGKLLQKLFQ